MVHKMMSKRSRRLTSRRYVANSWAWSNVFPGSIYCSAPSYRLSFIVVCSLLTDFVALHLANFNFKHVSVRSSGKSAKRTTR
ncbi:hypothetical protein PUN28_003876 [Cardiocondyla obscurior]|uniref:Ribosomal protein S14 n=1 Tax=Cardiocondyla obscurior TaxID=286306 RepID=A0AAW2GNQ5_9HYME